MNTEVVKRWIGQKPFSPFRVRTTGGGVHLASQLDYVSLDERMRTLVIWDDEFHEVMIDTRHIASIEHVNFLEEQ